jgi:hypothetical protein
MIADCGLALLRIADFGLRIESDFGLSVSDIVPVGRCRLKIIAD